MRVASRKGVSGDRWSEVSGTAKVGMYEQMNEVVRSEGLYQKTFWQFTCQIA